MAHEHLSPHASVTSAVHGDFWCGNILVKDDEVSGVIDWEAGRSPAARCATWPASCSATASTWTGTRGRGIGCAGIPASGGPASATACRYGLLGNGWFPDLVRRFLADGLGHLGLPPGLWYDVALAGLGEIAADANDEDVRRGTICALLAGAADTGRATRLSARCCR